MVFVVEGLAPIVGVVIGVVVLGAPLVVLGAFLVAALTDDRDA
jgi:hypothetical protein